MNKKNVKRYLRKAMNDVIAIDDAISSGASLNEREWFDFMVKSMLLEYVSGNTMRYWAFNREDCKIAQMYQDALSACVDAKVEGYSNKSAISVMWRMVRRVNKLFDFSNRVRMIHWDMSGVLYFQFCRHRTVWLEVQVKDVDSYVSAIVDLVEMGAADAYTGNCSIEFAELMTGYITRELKRIENGCLPEPVVGGVVSKSLFTVLKGGKAAANRLEAQIKAEEKAEKGPAKASNIVALPQVAP